jgi:hypothetical protein
MTQREELDVITVDGQLLDTGVFVKSLPEYLVVLGLYQMAGCKIWPWHEGYKEPNDGDERSLYVYKDVGFFKEIYPVAVGVKVLTIPELFEIVTGKQTAKWQDVPESVTPKESMVPIKDDDFILVPRGILGAACSAIYKRRDAPVLLSKLRELSMSEGAMRSAPVKDGA